MIPKQTIGHHGNKAGKLQRLIKRLTIVTLACACAGAQSQFAQNGFAKYPPAPKPEPLTETVHGVPVSDPYRWMERQDRRAKMVAWIKASSTQTTETLAKLPGRASLLKALENASRLSAIHDNVKLVAGRLFFTEIAPGQDIPVLKVRENGRDRLFLDPMAGASADSHRVISNYAPSPDGTLIAIHLADKQHGAWRSGNRYALPASPHPRRRLLELRNSCATPTLPTAQKIGHSSGLRGCVSYSSPTATCARP